MFSSHLNLIFLAFSRFDVVEYPLESKCTDLLFVRKTSTGIALVAFLAALVTTLFIWVETYVTKSAGLMTLCTPFVDPTQQVIMTKIVCCLFICGTFCTILFVAITYLRLFISLKLSQDKLKESVSKEKSNKPIIFQTVTTSVANLLCWIPSGTIYIVLMFLKKYPIELVSWTMAIFMPINSVVNPVLFSVGILRKLFK